jgi:hypothetical protein
LFVEPGGGDLSAASKVLLEGIMAKYGDAYRSFGHGALHGGIAGFFLALPVLAVNALFERKSFKYIGINAGYWMVSFMLTGGVVCQWG